MHRPQVVWRCHVTSVYLPPSLVRLCLVSLSSFGSIDEDGPFSPTDIVSSKEQRSLSTIEID